jgi:hypothetical protein
MLNLNNIKITAMKKLAYLLFISICLTGCQKCKKNKEPVTDYGVYTPPINLADYCYFKQGSYWVYQDSVGGAIDCTYVTSAQVVTYNVDANSGKDYTGTFNYYNMFTKNSIGDERQYEVRDEDAAYSAKCCNGRYFCQAHWNRPSQLDTNGNVIAGIYFGGYTHMFNNFINGVEGGGYGYMEKCTSKGEINSMIVNTFTFTNVAVFENYMNFSTNSWVTKQYKYKNYISKHNGVIKRIDIDSNKVWDLIRYNIIQ